MLVAIGCPLAVKAPRSLAVSAPVTPVHVSDAILQAPPRLPLPHHPAIHGFDS